jgi:DNA (cytosine-5)-methyltransferase 1
MPDRARRGPTFRSFVRKLERLGYVVEHRLLRACDFGAPTSRRRFFMIARCDGRAIVWPEPTHGPGRENPHRTAAECIDWTVPAPSIFDRKKKHADKTLARIARGIRKFVTGAAQPFVAPVNAPNVLIVPYMVHRSNGERPATATCPAQAPRIYDINNPLGTIMAQGQKHALVCAMLVKHNGGNNDAHGSSGQSLDKPCDTICGTNTKALTTATLARLDDEEAVDRAMAVHSFLVRYNGKGEPETLDKPLGTLTTRDRYGLVTVTVAGTKYAIVDIGMRMLTPRELFNAQGFAADYDITATSTREGVSLSKTAQVRMCGNSVPPPMGGAIVRAQFARAA